MCALSPGMQGVFLYLILGDMACLPVCALHQLVLLLSFWSRRSPFMFSTPQRGALPISVWLV